MIYIHKSNNQNIPPWLPLNIYVDFILIFILKRYHGLQWACKLKTFFKDNPGQNFMKSTVKTFHLWWQMWSMWQYNN